MAADRLGERGRVGDHDVAVERLKDPVEPLRIEPREAERGRGHLRGPPQARDQAGRALAGGAELGADRRRSADLPGGHRAQVEPRGRPREAQANEAARPLHFGCALQPDPVAF